MKKKIICFFLLITFLIPQSLVHAQAQSTAQVFDPKTKAFIVICGYGTVGGALLGLASMAFGQESKAIAQGASLGLYSGILFGAYVVFTHGPDYSQPDVPGNSESPYEDQYVPYQDGSTSYLNWNNSSSLAKLQSNGTPEDLLGPKFAWTWKF